MSARPAGAVDSLVLAIGSAVSGVLAYGFFALTTRTLGAAQAAPISVLWTYWSAAAAVVTLPLQHWIIRTLEAEGGGVTVRAFLPRIWGITAGLAVAASLATYPLRLELFGTDLALFPVLVGVITLGAALAAVGRGGLAGRRRYVATSLAMVAENGLRAVAAAAAVAAGLGATAFAGALVVGPITALLWPSSLRFDRDGRRTDSGSPVAFLGRIAGGSLVAQLVLTAGPVALALMGGSPSEVTSLFVALSAFRAPYIVALGVLPRLTGHLTSLFVAQDAARLRAFRRTTIWGTVLAALLAALAAGWFGLPLLRLVFGGDIFVPPVLLWMLAAGTCLGLGNLAFITELMSRGRSSAVFWAWLAALCVAGVAAMALTRAPLPRVVVAFVVAELGAFVVMALAGALGAGQLRPGRRRRASRLGDPVR